MKIEVFITGKLGESAGSQLLNSNTLFLGDAGGETESLDGATDTDSKLTRTKLIKNSAIKISWTVKMSKRIKIINGRKKVTGVATIKHL